MFCEKFSVMIYYSWELYTLCVTYMLQRPFGTWMIRYNQVTLAFYINITNCSENSFMYSSLLVLCCFRNICLCCIGSHALRLIDEMLDWGVHNIIHKSHVLDLLLAWYRLGMHGYPENYLLSGQIVAFFTICICICIRSRTLLLSVSGQPNANRNRYQKT